MRRGGFEHLGTTGKIQERRDRGRQGAKMLDDLASWFDKRSTSELIKSTRERER
uniref:Uncharacterized protein n=1 Tax=Arion vulgaris TaxID=1028688 RepID=A0A0B7BEB8_9EUPU